MRSHVMLAALSLALFGMVGATGCKSVCEKAMDKVVSCMEEYCEGEGAEEAGCENLEETIAEQQERMPSECPDEAAEQLQPILDGSCEDLQGMFGP